jgi:uncharacterized protein
MARDKMYSPAWWLPGGHLQTLWGKLARRPRSVPLRLHRWNTPDGDELEVYSLEAAAGAPHLLLLHGLEGSIRSHYANGLLSLFADAGWGAHFLIFRSCGESMNRARRLYHSGDTADVRFVLARLISEMPASPICIAGVSLGGNVLLKMLGELGSEVHPNVKAAATLSVPYDLALSARRINHGFSRVYQRFFLRTLKAKALEKQKVYPDLPDASMVRNVGTMVEFDDLITAPLHGFRNAEDYYRRSSSAGFLQGIRVPTLLISAADDPFLPRETLLSVREAAGKNPALHIEFPDRGGHAGFASGRFPWRAVYYAEHRILEFFQSIVESPKTST